MVAPCALGGRSMAASCCVMTLLTGWAHRALGRRGRRSGAADAAGLPLRWLGHPNLALTVSVIGFECGRGSGLSSGLERKRPPLPRLARRAECGPRRLVRLATQIAPTPFMPGHVALSVVCCDRRGAVVFCVRTGWFGRARLLKHCRMSHVPTTLVCSCSIAKSNRTTLRNAVVPSIYSHR